jgi:NitT/TauT family transport system substrate-binding protein
MFCLPAAAAFLILATACSPTATPAAPDKVTVGICPYITFSPLFIAMEEGYFAEQNLEVDLQMFENSTVAMPLLEQGQLDAGGNVPVAGLFNAINQTESIKIVADRGSLIEGGCHYFAMLASDEWLADHPNPTADDFRGMRISTDVNSFQGFLLDTYLESFGLTYDDMEVQYIPPPNLIEAANNGSVDFITTAEPWVTRVSNTGKMSVLVGFQEIMPGAQVGFLNLGRRLAIDDPELGERFVTAYVQGIRQYMEGKTERNLEIISEYTKLPADALTRVCWPDMRTDGSVNIDTVMAYQEWAVNRGQLDKIAPEDVIWDPRFATYAETELGPA